jgi:2TM domain
VEQCAAREVTIMTQTTSEYEQARARALKKRKLRGDLMAYVVINAFLIGIWAVSGFGYFWPGWVLAVWGAFLVLDAWQVIYRRDVTEEDIQRELHRIR